MNSLFYNAKILTMKSDRPLADSVVVCGSYFAYVGSSTEAENWISEHGVAIEMSVDCQGKLLIPGFNDSHMHYLHYVKAKFGVNLKGCTSIREITDSLNSYKNSQYDCSSGLWLTGEGWNQDLFTDERRFPTKKDLDAVSSEIPIVIMRTCFHIGVLNSKALEIAGINKNSISDYCEVMELDEDGEPNGVVKEGLLNKVKVLIPSPNLSQLVKKMEETQTEFFEKGITSVQSDDFRYVPSGNKYDFLSLLREESEKKLLKIRYSEQASLSSMEECKEFFEDHGLDNSFGNQVFGITSVKLLADGSLGGRTAFMKEPYNDSPNTCGINLYSQNELNDLVSYAHSHNIPVVIHAIGNAAIEMCLDAIEKAKKQYPHLHPRHGIIHCQITTPELIKRFSDLDVSALVQPIFIDSDMHIVKERVGDVLADTSYAWKDFINAGVHVSFGTDCPVESFDPMKGIYCAISECGCNGEGPFHENQCLSREQAIYGYTAAGAYQTNDELVKGKIQEGMLADCILLDEDITECKEADILNTNVIMTVLGGEIVFKKNSI